MQKSWRKEELVPQVLKGVEGLVPLIDAGYAPRPYLIMEFMERGDMRRLIGKVGLRLWADIASQLLSILDAAHRRGVWHLDLKPHNLYLTNDLLVKVGDWGISKVYPAIMTSFESSLPIGSEFYMAPEQFAGRSQTGPHSDLFSTGLLLTELFTGKHPIDSKNVHPAVVITRPDPIPIPPLGNTTSHTLSLRLLMNLTMKDPSSRQFPASIYAAAFRSIARETVPPDLDSGQLNKALAFLASNPVLQWLLKETTHQVTSSNRPLHMTAGTTEPLGEAWQGDAKVCVDSDVTLGSCVISHDATFQNADWMKSCPIPLGEISQTALLLRVPTPKDQTQPHFAMYAIFRSKVGSTYIGGGPQVKNQGKHPDHNNEWCVPIPISYDRWEWYSLDFTRLFQQGLFSEEDRPLELVGLRLRGAWSLGAVRYYPKT